MPQLSFQLIKPSLALFVLDAVQDGEEDKIQDEGDGGDHGISQEAHTLKGGMDDKHRVLVVCLFGGDEDAEHQIAIETDEVHSDHREQHMLHVFPKIDLYSAEQREQKQVKEERGMCDDALGDLIIGEGRVVDKVHIGEHPHQGGKDAEPENIVGKKTGEL